MSVWTAIRDKVSSVRGRNALPAKGDASAFSAEDVVTGYGGSPIVDGISIQLNPNEIVAILGPNGSGKSTLLKAMVRVLPLYSGTVRLDGDDISELQPHTASIRGIGYVPQNNNVFSSLTIKENLEIGLIARGRRPRLSELSAVLDGTFPELSTRLAQQAGTLSGGQRQMLAMAKVLVTEPSVLVLDEPTANLSPQVSDVVLDKMRDIRAQGIPILVVEQRVDLALSVSDRAYILVAGTIRRTGISSEIAGDPELYRLFLGGE